MSSFGLISLSMKIIGNRIVGRHAINELAPAVIIEEISSFYIREGEESSTNSPVSDLHNLIVGVIRFSTDANISVLGNYIRSINESNFQESEIEGFKILCFDDLVALNPELTLPCPTLFSDSIVLTCATEVWPDFNHPVMKRSISDLDYSNPNRQRPPFYIQGAEFLKF